MCEIEERVFSTLSVGLRSYGVLEAGLGVVHQSLAALECHWEGRGAGPWEQFPPAQEVSTTFLPGRPPSQTIDNSPG